MSASLGLYRLQKVDSQIDRARAQLETIRKTLENDVELRNALSQVETVQAEHYRTSNELKNAEAEAQAKKIKIEQTEASLYGGGVQNPKELQDLQKDIVSLKKHLVTLEERELEAMFNAEQAEKQLREAKTALEIVQAKSGNEHKKLLNDQAELMKDLERLREEREASSSPIEANLISIYEDLRKQKRGVAVTAISEDTCSSCGAPLNAALQQNAKSAKQLAHCPSCGRILFAS